MTTFQTVLHQLLSEKWDFTRPPRAARVEPDRLAIDVIKEDFMAPSITRHDLLIGIYDGMVTVVDARPAAVFAHRRICSSVNLPVEDAEHLADVVLPDKNEPIVTYCEAGSARAEALAMRLIALGYSDVRVYREGFEDWLAADLPAERPSSDDIAA